MKKILSVILGLSFCLLSKSLFAFSVPQDRDGISAMSIQDVGVLVLTVSGSSQPSIVTGSTIAIFGVLTSTSPDSLGAATSAYVELRSTGTANVTSERLVPPLLFSSTTRNTLYVFYPPILAPVGVSVNIATAPNAAASLFYRFVSTNTDPDFFIPRDGYTGNKVFGSDFYGVKVASEVTAGAVINTVGTDGLDNTTVERIVETERGFFFGFMCGNPQPLDFVIFEDSAAVTGNAADFLPPIFPATFNDDDYQDSEKSIVIRFPWPLIFNNGLTVAFSRANETRMFTRPARSLR